MLSVPPVVTSSITYGLPDAVHPIKHISLTQLLMVIHDHDGAHRNYNFELIVGYSFKPNHNPCDCFYLQILHLKNVSTNKYTSI